MLIFAVRLAGSRQLIHGQGECRGRKKNEGMQIPSMIGPPWPCLPSAGQPAGSAEGCGHQRDIALTLLATCIGQERLQKRKAGEPEAMPWCATTLLLPAQPGSGLLSPHPKCPWPHISCCCSQPGPLLRGSLCSSDQTCPLLLACSDAPWPRCWRCSQHSVVAHRASCTPSLGEELQRSCRENCIAQALSHHGCADMARKSWAGSSHSMGGDGESRAGASLLSLLCPQPWAWLRWTWLVQLRTCPGAHPA